MKKSLLIISVFVLLLSVSACDNPISSQKDGNTEKTVEKVVDKKITEKLNKEVESEDGKMEESNSNEGIEQGSGEEVSSEENEDEKNNELPISIAQQILLILDASGSMWGQIDGETKIDIAKDVVKNTVKNFQDVELGLMAYGHRKKGDCTDIEILTSPKKNNADNISSLVDGISPIGMTPMGDSVLKAAESLKYTEQKATVVLVSDGIETCDVDLCALGKKLEELGVDFTAHVIGFDMTEEQTTGLKCLANETGGKFISAKDSKSLSDALGEVVEASACSKEKLGEAIINASKEIEANTEFVINWTGPNEKKDVITLLKKDDDNQNNHFNYVSDLDSKNGTVKLKAPTEEGEYDLVYFAECGTELGRFPLKVVGTSATLSIPKTAVVGSEMSVSWTGPGNYNDAIGIFPKDDDSWNNHFYVFDSLDSKNSIAKLQVPNDIGEYDVVYWLGEEEILVRESFEAIEATASITIIGEVSADSKFEVTWIGPDNSSDAITIVPKGSIKWNDHVGGNLYRLAGKNGKGELTAPEELGEYDVIYWLNQKKILDKKSIIVTN